MVEIDGNNLKIEEVVKVAREYAKVELSEDSIERIKKARKRVESILKKGKPVYGVNTGVGKLGGIVVPLDDILVLQENLVRSHAVGVGDRFSDDVVRAAMLLRANTFAKGYSGVRLELVEALVNFINRRVHPLIPEKGSVGASGDLAPLAHIALALIGEGDVFYKGARRRAKEVLRNAGLKPLKLAAKESVALMNGTAIMTSLATLSIYDSVQLLKNAQVASAMSFEALQGSTEGFSEELVSARGHEGQIQVAKNMMKLLEGRREPKKNMQDPYTLRCIPQVLGAVYDALRFVETVVSTELNSANDNPLVFGNTVLSGGNFHGHPIALCMDFLGIAVSSLGTFSERRIARLMSSENLPSFLTEKGGLNTGLMMAQYTAASLASENKVLAHPASVDSIPTSGNHEDYNSMGTIAARKAREIIDNARCIIAVEYLCASQALEFVKSSKLGKGVKSAYKLIRNSVPKIKEDRALYKDIETIQKLIFENAILSQIEIGIGKLV